MSMGVLNNYTIRPVILNLKMNGILNLKMDIWLLELEHKILRSGGLKETIKKISLNELCSYPTTLA